MITIKASAFNGQPTTRPIEATFDELGGSIGRANANALVLPDPERLISRTHATIVFRNGGYVLRDLGSTSAVQVNGRPVGKGREARLAPGDQLQIGAYTLQVLSAPPPAPRDDPLAVFGPLDADPPGHASPAASPEPAARGTIPSQFDPFADIMAPPPAQHPDAQVDADRLPDDLNFGLGPAGTQTIDQLFGLEATSQDDPFGEPPSGHHGQGANRAISQDPLVAIGAVPVPGAPPAPQRDDAMEINAAFIPPSVSFTSEHPAPEQADASNMLFSWDVADRAAPGGDIQTVIIASPHPMAAPAQPAPVQARQPRIEAQRAGAPGASTPASGAELLRAFQVGAGVLDLDMGAPLTPAMMHTLGQLLRVSTQGTLDLLLARALLKREVCADVTMIAAHDNNPLKFSPSVEVALAHLLAPRGHGFMPPVAAIKDACDDLRAHQFAFMAGMRAALDGVLRRFDPAQLERRLTDQGVIDALLPMVRKARLWMLFGELYGDLAGEAQDDFHALFGKEFLRAYEAQLAQLDKDARAAGR
ncbi:MAG TPA: type VI secretion system-associated FHA domain protein TagH [Telluria sp.]|jgi:type VI secretion system FHA domain protein